METADAWPSWLLRGEKAEKPSPTAVRKTAERTADEKRPILCRRCRQEVSDRSLLFSMGDAGVRRVFSNPYGLLLEIVTVLDARGLTLVSLPTTEFTWFPGYAWEVAMCSTCGVQLGWRFLAVAASEPERFFGLLTSAIVLDEGG